MSCQTYKALIDVGWRRSGSYLYKPDMRATCCPQYTISLDAAAFNPSKSQRQLLHRFANFVTEGGREGTSGWGPPSSTSNATTPAPTPSSQHPSTKADSLLSTAKSVTFNPSSRATIDEDEDNAEFKVPSSKKGKRKAGDESEQSAAGRKAASSAGQEHGYKAKGKSKGKGRAAPVDLSDMVHEGEWSRNGEDKPFKHRFEYVLEEASFTEEKYALFQRYQTQIHGEPDSKVTKKGFKRFLVDSPLETEPTSNPKYNYGSQHGLYYLDGRLIALAVIDVLPGAVSSVYLAWDPDYAGLGLGKISALREIAMVREMKKAGVEGMSAYMMGYYIHSCVKMRYKGEYQPSSLLDPATNVFYPFEHCAPLLDANSHASFSSPPKPPTRSDTNSSTSSLPIAIPSANSSSESPPSRNNAMTPLAERPPLSDEEDVKQREGSGETETEEEEEEDEDDDEIAWPELPPPGCFDPAELPKGMLMGTLLLENRMLVPLLFSSSWHDTDKQVEIRELLAATGESVAGKVAIWVG
ncbi:arginine-tRNA-protein transferase [Leucosporidium creatinivorum]|uniref:arginyltransferase n=1 Tax=Leucosporidium creatinivorum TaxID=106004 RepID=A0A1Y2G1V9_9BASI|nr:arginine-tRNA-protein transferase [Leucosporidium creatinivorum]